MQVLFVPELNTRAATVLGDLGTAKAQQSLLDLAGLAAQPIDTRNAAAAAFAHSVKRHGILLTSDEILRQYDLYNTNAGSDPETHAVLGAILDAIESKNHPKNE